jgi:hypothetical protein
VRETETKSIANFRSTPVSRVLRGGLRSVGGVRYTSFTSRFLLGPRMDLPLTVEIAAQLQAFFLVRLIVLPTRLFLPGKIA